MKIFRPFAVLFLMTVFLGVLLNGCANSPQTPDALKAMLNQPLLLLGVMYLGALGSALTTVGTAKRDGSSITYRDYLGRWETIVAAIIAVPITWAGLLLADQLNFAAAAAFGAVANTGMDKFKGGGRSLALKTSTGSGDAP